MNRKKIILIISGTLLMGILIGITAMSMFSEKNKKLYSEVPTIESIKQKVIQKLELDDAQIKQIEPFLNTYSAKASELTKEHLSQLLASFEIFYSESKPYLNEKQKEKFEKRINRLKSKIKN